MSKHKRESTIRTANAVMVFIKPYKLLGQVLKELLPTNLFNVEFGALLQVDSSKKSDS
ncbi:MAG: hypothetical protein PXY39_04715 [archaeon]|nr:hypothetical protein [archaeon]